MKNSIRFVISPCSLGYVLVAETANGICAIALDDDEQALSTYLQNLFPKALLIPNHHSIERVAQVLALIEAPQLPCSLPLDIQGTAFQQQVWQALRAIAPGTTLSYSQLAEAIGAPKAVRAVAGACAANKLAVAIPCHRIIHKNSNNSGYRWGVARKAELLRREQLKP